jgi:hypothetical protein
MLKLKRTILWLIPVIAMALVVAYVVLSPMLAIHAAQWNGQ